MSTENVKKKRRVFTKEFKIEACKLVVDEGRSRAEVARNLGIHHVSISNWVRAYQVEKSSCFPGNGQLKPDTQEIRDLKSEIRRLQMERDILKKAIAYVADHDD